jgi:hypothetical protein
MEANFITIILLLVTITVLVYMIYHKNGSSNKSTFNTNPTTTTVGNVAVPTMMETSGNEIVQPAGYYYDGYPDEDPYVYDYPPEYYYDPLYWYYGRGGSGGNYGGWGGRHRGLGGHGISSGAIAHGYGGGMHGGGMGGHMGGSGHSGGWHR